ncbi:unnamed protein product [Lymnaea stagnalis]|uniref:G-protein coupled receptors family 1 profile domain-containing protein n=1 Tax=Lymnaea stagnalis TaxID=6523 RepID=A0AAV2I7C2_LYMST
MVSLNITPTLLTATGDLSVEANLAILSFLFYFLWPFLILFGVVSNMINIVVFTKMGLHDSVSVSFFVLSVTELLYLLFSIAVATTGAIGLQPWQSSLPVGVYFLGGYIAWYQEMFLEISMAIIAYIGLARCCCVAIALKFKHTFTVTRTLVFLSGLISFSVGNRIPILRTTGLAWVTNPLNNTTRLLAWFSDDFNSVKKVYELINRNIFPTILLIVVLVCSVILTYTLIVASRNRRAMTGKALAKNKKDIENLVHRMNINTKDVIEDYHIGSHNYSTKRLKLAKAHTLSSKEIQIVKQVTAVASFLLLAVLVQSMNSLAQVIVPEFMSGRSYKRIYNVMIGFSYSCCYLNTCVNFLIYIKFNSKFRGTFQRVFLCSSTGKN